MAGAIDRFLAEFCERAETFYGDRLISLAVFGSHASGRAHSRSNLDLLIIQSTAAPRRRLPKSVTEHLSEIRRMSKRLRRERELAFYGDDDFIPSDEYDAEDSGEAIQFAEAIVSWVEAGWRELKPA